MRTLRILTLTFCCGANPAWAIVECDVHGNAINLNNGKSTEQLTGIVRCRDQGSQAVKREIPYRNGVIDGVEKMLAADGNWHETTYLAGKRHGLKRTFSQERKLLADSQYVNDRELGDAHYYYANGQVQTHIQHAIRSQETLRFEYNENGRLSELRCGLQSSVAIGRSGCRYGARSEVLKTYYPDDVIKEIIMLKNGLRDGTSEYFSHAGKRRQLSHFSHGKLWRQENYTERGELRERTDYVEDENSRPRKEGLEEFFFADGKLEVRIEWRQGRKVATEQRWQNGQVRQRLSSKSPHEELEETFFDNGKPEKIEPRLQVSGSWGQQKMQRHGTVQRYYENGQLAAEEKYIRGQLSGSANHYYENGQLSVQDEYRTGRLVKRKSFSKEGKLEKDEAYHEDGSRVR